MINSSFFQTFATILQTATIVLQFLLAMAATLERPPTPTFCWSPKHILIEGSPGQDSINICDIFKFSSEFQQKCAKGSETERLILPVEVYPPNEDQCDLIRDRIIDAAKKQADTYLVKGKVDKFASGGEKWYYLLCEKGMTVYSRDAGSRRSNHDIYGVDKENTAYQKDGVKNHVIVNKQSTSRGPAGLREPRKTHTKKPPLGCLCKFKLILRQGNLSFGGSQSHNEGQIRNES